MRELRVTVELAVCYDDSRITREEVRSDLVGQVARFAPQEQAPYRNVTGGAWWTAGVKVTSE